ncbi:solute symporter family protein [Klebsormidium nitens]|uniref:Solute symporter family protein n=1 Tax=Klebsormidium nitens TaxID=105231 RepID=A0A1Y1HQL6_KLENI|nr:solute symporter family protein [Klebsormidium nitens]|eukprot:GAQ80925.1 solute symporter family protein [Klebsormidium nitens]
MTVVKNLFLPSETEGSVWRRYLLQPTGWLPLLIGTILLIVVNALGYSLQWNWLIIYGMTMLPLSPWVSNPVRFFNGGLKEDSKSNSSILLLASSAFIVWIFAKSINNASTLGAKYGVLGGFAYATYYTSFFSASIVIYFLRTRMGYKSLPEAINARYGTLACLSFGAAVLYRLFQEVWSNSIVVAGFYGTAGSGPWWTAAILSTLLPLVYSFTGGMRASLLTDAVQAVIAIVFLIATLAYLVPKADRQLFAWNGAGSCALAATPPGLSTFNGCALAGGAFQGVNGLTGLAKVQSAFTPARCNYTAITDPAMCSLVKGVFSAPKCALKSEPVCTGNGGVWSARSPWSLAGGWDLLIVGLMQGILSYPFFDPVLTDRCFLAEPKAMVKAFSLGGSLAGCFIILFSLIGVFGNQTAILHPERVPEALFAGMLGGAPAAVSKYLGTAIFSIINIIFLTESISTVDSTFTSTAKLFGPEFAGVIERGAPDTPANASKRHLYLGRLAIVIMAVGGTLPLLADPKVLNATTVSGTVVLGLGPPVYALMFIKGYRPLVFHLPFWTGVAFGVVFQLSSASCCRDYINVKGFAMGSGSEQLLLGFNVIGSLCAWGVCGICLLENVPAYHLLKTPGADESVLGSMTGWFRRGRKDDRKEAEADYEDVKSADVETPASAR